jgi:hypothetical protein
MKNRHSSILVFFLFILIFSPLAAQEFTQDRFQSEPLATFGISTGLFSFIQGGMVDHSKILWNIALDMEYRITQEISAGLVFFSLIHPEIEWFSNGFILMPGLSAQLGDSSGISHRIDLFPPMWGQPYIMAGYGFQVYGFMILLHGYYDWERSFSALNFSAGYQLSF